MLRCCCKGSEQVLTVSYCMYFGVASNLTDLKARVLLAFSKRVAQPLNSHPFKHARGALHRHSNMLVALAGESSSLRWRGWLWSNSSLRVCGGNLWTQAERGTAKHEEVWKVSLYAVHAGRQGILATLNASVLSVRQCQLQLMKAFRIESAENW